MNNYLAHFHTAEHPFFISAVVKPGVPEGVTSGVALTVTKGEPSELTFDQLWGDFEPTPTSLADSVSTAVIAVNTLRNLIAARTRRSFGNLLFTADIELIELLKTQRSLQDMTFVHVPELPVGEVRVALFSKDKLLEAGVALYDSQLYAHDSYSNYFARVVL